MDAMLMTMMECRKEQEKQKRVCKQCALSVPLRNSGKLRWYCVYMMNLAMSLTIDIVRGFALAFAMKRSPGAAKF